MSFTSTSAHIAYKEWASRPDDERFESLQTLHDILAAEALITKDLSVRYADTRVDVVGGDLALIGGRGIPARFSHWSFGQYSSMLSAPTAFMRDELRNSPTLAAQILNHQRARMSDGDTGRMLVRTAGDGDFSIRAFNGRLFGRIFDQAVVSACLRLERDGWKVPPARPVRTGQRGTRIATEADVLKAQNLSLSVRVGDEIAPAGVYRGDRDLFVFMVDESTSIEVNGQQLFRMIIARNSEVGAGHWELTYALIVGVCGNHILHGLQDVATAKVRHVGRAAERAEEAFELTYRSIERGHTDGLSDAAKTLSETAGRVIAVGMDNVVNTLFGLKSKLGLTRNQLTTAYQTAEAREAWYGAPNTTWGMANGLTEASQACLYADDRMAMDRAAATLLQMTSF